MKFGSLDIERFELGPFATNCYFVTDNVTACIVDASFEPAALVKHGKREQAFVSDIEKNVTPVSTIGITTGTAEYG